MTPSEERVVGVCLGDSVAPFGGDAPLKLARSGPVKGAVVLVSAQGNVAEALTTLAAPNTVRARLYHLAHEAGVMLCHSAVVEREVHRIAKTAGAADAALVDLTAMPFVTIDNVGSKDLDQALCIEPGPSGSFVVHYAIADAAAFVRPGAALWDEALARGASYYLPGLVFPMLPKELSEDLVSLNQDVRRRALVFSMTIASSGEETSTTVRRALVHSQAKLSFEAVQALYDGDKDLEGQAYTYTLHALKEVGQARLAQARDVVRYRRRELRIVPEGTDGTQLAARAGHRAAVELYNEQISILCNRVGARILYQGDGRRAQPIYRVHPAPEAERLAAFAAFTRNMAKLHNLGEPAWVWDERVSFAQFVDQLPRGGDRDGISRAIERQAMLVNAKSSFATEAGAHFGVGADLYARFSAPMREIVGVHSHKELWEITESGPLQDPAAEIALRTQVVLAANTSKERQRKVNDLVLRALLDQIFAEDIASPLASRPIRMGTVMGVAKAKLHVELDDPPSDAKLYLADVGATLGGVWLKADEAGTELKRADTGAVVCRAGDRIGVQVVRQDKARDRWGLSIAAPR